MFVAHIILLLGLPASLVAASPVEAPIKPVHNVLAAVGETTSDTASASTYWVANVKRQGVVPFANGTDYKIFRNVMDFGAKGT